MSPPNQTGSKKHSVGLVVLTFFQGQKVAVLQKRGLVDFEKMKMQSWSGACQITVHGQVEPTDQTPFDTLLREAKEEIGLPARTYFFFERPNPFVLLHEAETDREHVSTYAIQVEDQNFLRHVRLESSTGGIRLVTSPEVQYIEDLAKNYTKEKGVDKNVIAMFLDEKLAVEKAFEVFP